MPSPPGRNQPSKSKDRPRDPETDQEPDSVGGGIRRAADFTLITSCNVPSVLGIGGEGGRTQTHPYSLNMFNDVVIIARSAELG